MDWTDHTYDQHHNPFDPHKCLTNIHKPVVHDKGMYLAAGSTKKAAVNLGMSFKHSSSMGGGWIYVAC